MTIVASPFSAQGESCRCAQPAKSSNSFLVYRIEYVNPIDHIRGCKKIFSYSTGRKNANDENVFLTT